jgi:hypothetical protein
MPGISQECSSGAHAACQMGTECRCTVCHPWTQALIKKGSPKPDPRGGIRRKRLASIPGEVPIDAVPVESPLEVFNTCPKCGAKAKPTDIFCRADGEKLLLGKQCLSCGAPGNPEDQHCWQCGLKHGTKPPVPAPLPEEIQTEDSVTRLQREAKELGLLKETVVS